MRSKISVKMYKLYNKYLYSRFENFRGFYRLLRFFRWFAERNCEKIDPDNAEGVFDYEWDNLVIIDSCRHDLYEEVVGECESRISLGSCSEEFYRRNFSNQDLSDVVYVTACHYIEGSKFESLVGEKPKNVFYEVIDLHEECWDEEKGTVPPEEVYKNSLEVAKKYPDKNMIIHFLQPHRPFIGYEFDNIDASKIDGEIGLGLKKANHIWHLGQMDAVTDEEIWGGYKSNLERVMEYVDDLSEKLDGKTMITSDHGNFVGESGIYAHPHGSKAKVVREVPLDFRD